MARTLIAACGGPAVAQVRKTFPMTPYRSPTTIVHRRGRLLSRGSLTLAELPPLPVARSTAGRAGASAPTGDTPARSTDGETLASFPAGDMRGEDRTGSDALELTAELAFYLGHCLECTAVLLVIPAPRLTLADRIIAPGRRELIPDLLEPASRIDASVTVTAVDGAVVWAAAQWALRRVGPHQFWVVGLPVEADQPRGGEGPGRRAHGHRSSAHAADLQAAATHAADPQPAAPTTDSDIHRGLRSVVAALEEQTR